MDRLAAWRSAGKEVMMELSTTIKKLKENYSESIVDLHSFRGDDTVIVRKDDILLINQFLRDDSDLLYNFMMDLTAVDYLGRDPRFEVVYHLYSLKYNSRIRVKACVTEDDCSIDSCVSIWIASDWFEREVFDLYGIVFKGHPNLKRLLLYPEFVGHPLRKDYPIKGRQPLIGPKN